MLTKNCGSHRSRTCGLHWVMRIEESVTAWGEVGTGLRPKEKMLSEVHQLRGDGCRAG